MGLCFFLNHANLSVFKGSVLQVGKRKLKLNQILLCVEKNGQNYLLDSCEVRKTCLSF